MPVVVDPDSSVIAKLLTALPPGAHGVESSDRLGPWLDHRNDEYLVVLGPSLEFNDALLGGGLKVLNPQATHECACGESFSI